jgi:hypothetical protein
MVIKLIDINKPINELVTDLNLLIQKLNYKGLKIYDDNDPEFFINRITYNSEEDTLYASYQQDRYKEEVK